MFVLLLTCALFEQLLTYFDESKEIFSYTSYLSTYPSHHTRKKRERNSIIKTNLLLFDLLCNKTAINYPTINYSAKPGSSSII